jgi:hypothetical protein
MKHRARVITVVLSVLALAGTVSAQRPVRSAGPGVGDNSFQFLGAHGGFGEKVVKGSPYSAEAVTESTQVLQDGNRILRRSTATVYRDSEGRTRRDQVLSAIGPWALSGEPLRSSLIRDPVAGVDYVLDPAKRTARKMTRPSSAKGDASRQTDEVRGARREAASQPRFRGGAGSRDVEREALGTQVIEGVQAEGERTTLTLPAGQAGNTLPIRIVSERWYSPDLQAEVLTRHSDPRFGETVYRLTNIQRAEPSHSMFEVPSDYTVTEGSGWGREKGSQGNTSPGGEPRMMRRKPGA